MKIFRIIPLSKTVVTAYVTDSCPFNTFTKTFTFRTSSDGNFSKKTQIPSGETIKEIRFAGSGLHLDGGTDGYASMGTIIATPTANFVVKLQVNNPYNVGDTLLVPNYNDIFNGFKLPCPVRDTIFNPVYNYSSLGYPTLTNKNTVEVKFNHSVYNGIIGTSSFNQLKGSFSEFIIPGCSGQLDTIVKVID